MSEVIPPEGSDPQTLLLKLLLEQRAPPREDRSPTRHRIVSEAIKLFAAQGYAFTSMRDIGAAAGIKAASIYAHFAGGKEQLLAEALEEVLRDFQTFVVEPMRADQSHIEQLEHLVRRHVTFHIQHASLTESWDVLLDVDRLAKLLPAPAHDCIAKRRALYHDLVKALVAVIKPSDQLAYARSEAILTLCDRASSWRELGQSLPAEQMPDFIWSLTRAILWNSGDTDALACAPRADWQETRAVEGA